MRPDAQAASLATRPPDARSPAEDIDVSVVSAILGQALAYAAAGWPVFPCRPDDPSCSGGRACECKAPLTRNGFKDGTTDPAVIRDRWRRSPTANPAICTGAPGPDVLDVDVKPDGSGFVAFNRLKRAGLLAGALALVRTPSGGLHAYYTGTGQPSGRLPRHYLDLKAAGGYVIAPPGRVHGRPYTLLDHRGTDGRLDWQAARQLLDPVKTTFSSATKTTFSSVTRLAEWVAVQPEGNRNSGLYWAARRAIESGLDPAELLPAAIAVGLSESEARRTIASAARRAGR